MIILRHSAGQWSCWWWWCIEPLQEEQSCYRHVCPICSFLEKVHFVFDAFIKPHRATPFFRGEIFAASIFQRLPFIVERSLCVWVSTRLSHKCSKRFSTQPGLLLLMYFTGAGEIVQWLMCLPRMHEEDRTLDPQDQCGKPSVSATSVLLAWTRADSWSLLVNMANQFISFSFSKRSC